MNQPSSPIEEPDYSRPKDRELSGKAIVVGMVILGLTLTALLFTYFEYNTRPFRPLREAIGREFPRSRPMVEGGKLKGKGANTLRMSFSVPFDPSTESNLEKMKPVLSRTLELARQYQDLSSYDVVEVNLIHFRPEKDAIRWQLTWKGSEAESDLAAVKYEARQLAD